MRDLRNEGAWVQFLQIYAPVVYGFLRKKGLQDADAADLTQEVWRAVARALPRLDYDPQRGSFRGWLFTIVRNKLKNYQGQRREQGGGDTETVRVLHRQPQAECGEEEWAQDCRRRLFAWAAEQVRPQVSEMNWRAFWLTGVEGKTPLETAKTLGVTLTAVYTAKCRMLARIKEVLDQVKEDVSNGE